MSNAPHEKAALYHLSASWDTVFINKFSAQVVIFIARLLISKLS
jgi:hypothetical protein